MINDLYGWFANPANWQGDFGVPHRLLEHLVYSAIALAVALLIGVPLGLVIGHTGRGTFVVAGAVNALRALPTLGLLLLVILLLGSRIPGEIGFALPAIVVLIVLAVPPILAGTYSGVAGVDPDARDAAYGIGMTGRDVLWQVEVPGATPLFMSGLRSAALQVISTATIAAYAGLGGLGRFLIDGLAVRDYPQVLAGAVLVAALAIVAEVSLARLQAVVVPRGISGRFPRAATLQEPEAVRRT